MRRVWVTGSPSPKRVKLQNLAKHPSSCLHGSRMQLRCHGRQMRPATCAAQSVQSSPYRVRRWCPHQDDQEVGRLWQESLLSTGLTSLGRLDSDTAVEMGKELQLTALHRLHKAQERKLRAAQQCRSINKQLPSSKSKKSAEAQAASAAKLVQRLQRQRMWACLVVEPLSPAATIPDACGSDPSDSPINDLASNDPASSPPRLAAYILVSVSQPLALLPPPFPTNTPHVLHVDALAVDPAHRRQGLATQLLNEAEILAARWKQKSLWLEVEATNQPAVQLYCGKLGFKVARSLGWPWRRTRKLILWKPVSGRPQPHSAPHVRSTPGQVHAQQQLSVQGEGACSFIDQPVTCDASKAGQNTQDANELSECPVDVSSDQGRVAARPGVYVWDDAST